jgi:hypothetical protein
MEKSKPLPVSVTLCGLSPAASVILNVPVLVPPAVGSKNTPIVQLEPTATGLLQLLRTPKSARLAVAPVMLRVAFPVFVTVTVCGRPLVPTYCPGNVILDGDELTMGAGGGGGGGGTLPCTDIACGLPGASSDTEITAVAVPCFSGVNVTLTWQLAPGANVKTELLL